MTDRIDSPEEEDARTPIASDQSRPIPDGGLGSSMPAWLRQPPSWKRTEAPQAARKIPPPDTSTIDPGVLLQIDDLPRWLQAVAQRDSGRDLHVAEDRSHALQTEPEPGHDHDSPSPTLVARGEFVSTLPRAPHVASETRAPSPSSPGQRDRPWWMSDGVIAGLLVAVILTMLFVVLVASNVI